VSAPSGEQIAIELGDRRAVVVEVGGGLRVLSAGGLELLDGYGEDEPCTAARGQILVPWPNRLEDGSYEFDGRRHQLPIDEPSGHHAIHGLVRRESWTVAARAPDRVELEHVLRPRPGYPFSLALRVEYALAAEGLAVCMTATNVGDAACPYGAGAHPYLRLGTRVVDPLVLRIPAATRIVANARLLPVGSTPVAGTEYDFRDPRPIGATVFDTCYTELERGADGRARVELREPDGGAALTLWADESFSYLQVFTGDPIPDVRRRSLAVEPMTCPPNAFRSGEALVRLEPGESHTGAWGIEFRGGAT